MKKLLNRLNFKNAAEEIKNPVTFFSIITIVLFGFFLFYGIGKASINNDAQLWYFRSQNFVKGLQTGQLNLTYQNPKPGVTVMWLSGLSLETFLTLYEKYIGFRPFIYTYETFKYVHFSVIAPLVTVIFISMIFFYLFIKKMFDGKTALYTLILTTFQPFFIGISRHFHADGLVTSFMVTSAFTSIYFLIYCEKTGLKKQNPFFRDKNNLWVILSGVLGGLALLSKSAAIFLIPYVFFISLIHSYFYKKTFWFYFRFICTWFTFMAATYFILFPAMWFKPLEILKRIFVNEGLNIVSNARDGSNVFYYYLEPLSRVLTPVFLLSFVIGSAVIGFLIKEYFKSEKFISKGKNKKHVETDTKKTTVILMVAGYVIFYLIQMSIVDQKMERYLMPLIPVLALIGAIGINHLEKVLEIRKNRYFISKNKSFSSYKKTAYKTGQYFLPVFFAINILTVIYYFPNYLLYPSETGKDQFGCSLCSDIGEYLNSQPNPGDLKIISLSEKLHRIQPYVKGKVYTTNEILPNNWTPEYLITSEYETVPDPYSYCQYEKSIGFRGVKYWKIFKCK